jgi:hypothetical protein
MVVLHNVGACCLRVVGIGAAELKRNHSYAETFSEFQQRLAAVELGDVEILRPIAYLGLSFVNWSVVGGDAPAELERHIHTVLFPTIEFEFGAYCAARGLEPERAWGDPLTQRWSNAKCDVLALWCHIWHGGDMFVTTDRNFHKATKKPHLIALGAGDIMYPIGAVEALRTLGASRRLVVG